MTSQELIRRNKTISKQKVTVIKTVDGVAPEVPDGELVHEDIINIIQEQFHIQFLKIS